MRSLWLFALLSLAGCGSGEQPHADRRPTAPSPSAPAPVPAKPADTRPAIVVFGDSISAGFGLDAGQSYPDLLQRDLDRRGIAFRVVNMGVSGDTTQDGLARISLALAEKPAIALLELGGNDGLRGIPIAITRQNLAAMIEDFQQAGARVVLAGMTLPPNYGPDYIRKFDAVYRDLAARYKVTLIPFLLEGVGGDPRYMQHDGLHPNAEGARRVEALVMKALEPLLRR
ncbi:MAG: arylesterase [Acidobacteria bacterium]|nr:arylesterase [Acidobacteriota bacterium]